MQKAWYQKAYHRNVVDVHITDLDPSFLSKLDAESYVAMLKQSRSESAVVYAHSHVGYSYYDAADCSRHPLLHDDRYLQKVIDACHRENIGVVLYVSLIFDNWAFYANPDWRIVDAKGEEQLENHRCKVCCPNSGYRNFVVDKAKDLCRRYDVEGIRFDMTYWPAVCYCAHCKAKLLKEEGFEPPTKVDWFDPQWVAFQRARERWLTEFAELATNAVREVKPRMTVEHQASTYIAPWSLGVTVDLSEQNDYLQGDFYGGYAQGSFACKLFYHLSENLPFGYETSSNEKLSDHTTLKKTGMLETKACLALANGGAFIFIDAIDPVGTLNPKVYQTLGDIMDRTRDYEAYLGGTLVEDVAIYVGTESKVDFDDNGKFVLDAGTRNPHVDAAFHAAQALMRAHIPFGVITKRNIADLHRYPVLILPNLMMIAPEEADAFREYVRHGGKLYASKWTSLVTTDGRKHDEFLLSDVFGVNFRKESAENFTYLAPGEEVSGCFEGYSSAYPMSVDGTQMLVKAKPGADVLADVVLPYTNPVHTETFASIHSNPPGIPAGAPALVRNRFGKGEAYYASADLENNKFHLEEFANLIRWISGRKFRFSSDAHPALEITAFEQEELKRTVIHMLSLQELAPPLPHLPCRVLYLIGGRKVKQVETLPGDAAFFYSTEGDTLTITVPGVHVYRMIVIQYE